MFGYMTELATVEETKTEEITAQGNITFHSSSLYPTTHSIPLHTHTHTHTGDDLESLLFHFLDEFLFTFSADPFFIPKVCKYVIDDLMSMLCHCIESKNH